MHQSAAESRQPAITDAPVAAQIKLSTKSFGRDAAEVAAEAIASVSGSLVDADMSDVIAGRPEAEALDALRIMSAALSRLQLRQVTPLHTQPCGACKCLLCITHGSSGRSI